MPEPRSPTLQDVADAAGLSRSAAGYAMRNHPMVSAETCRRVQEIAERIGYRPNPLVSALMTRVRRSEPLLNGETVAYVTAYTERGRWRRIPSQREFFEGAQARADQLGYRLEEFSAAEKGMSGARLSDILHARGIRGVILGPLPDEHPGVTLKWEFFALAAIGYSQRGVDLHRVTFDHYHAMQLALRRLAEAGARKVGLAVPDATSDRTDRLWEAAFDMFVRRTCGMRAARPFIPEWTRWKQELFLAWLEREKPDALVACDPAPRWLLDAPPALQAGTRVAVLNYRGHPAPICGIDQNNRAVGAAAVDLVVSQLHHNERGLPAKPRLTLLEGEWIEAPVQVPGTGA